MSERVNQLRFPVTLTEKQYVELRDEAMKAGELRERARAAKAPAPSGGEAHPVTPTDPEQAAARFCFATSRRGNLSVTVEMEPDPSGPWVAWEDYAAILAERDRLREVLQGLAERFDEAADRSLRDGYHESADCYTVARNIVLARAALTATRGSDA